MKHVAHLVFGGFVAIMEIDMKNLKTLGKIGQKRGKGRNMKRKTPL